MRNVLILFLRWTRMKGNDAMSAAAIFLPLLLISLFMISAVHEELAHPRHSPRLAAAVRAPETLAFSATSIDPGAIVAINVSDFERRYSTSPIATCDSGADRL
jgi:cytosine/uracil/thiamine/allantoin permease